MGTFEPNEEEHLDDGAVSYVSPISGHFSLISRGMKLYKNEISKLYLTRDNDANWVVSSFCGHVIDRIS